MSSMLALEGQALTKSMDSFMDRVQTNKQYSDRNTLHSMDDYTGRIKLPMIKSDDFGMPLTIEARSLNVPKSRPEFHFKSSTLPMFKTQPYSNPRNLGWMRKESTFASNATSISMVKRQKTILCLNADESLEDYQDNNQRIHKQKEEYRIKNAQRKKVPYKPNPPRLKLTPLIKCRKEKQTGAKMSRKKLYEADNLNSQIPQPHNAEEENSFVSLFNDLDRNVTVSNPEMQLRRSQTDLHDSHFKRKDILDKRNEVDSEPYNTVSDISYANICNKNSKSTLQNVSEDTTKADSSVGSQPANDSKSKTSENRSYDNVLGTIVQKTKDYDFVPEIDPPTFNSSHTQLNNNSETVNQAKSNDGLPTHDSSNNTTQSSDTDFATPNGYTLDQQGPMRIHNKNLDIQQKTEHHKFSTSSEPCPDFINKMQQILNVDDRKRKISEQLRNVHHQDSNPYSPGFRRINRVSGPHRFTQDNKHFLTDIDDRYYRSLPPLLRFKRAVKTVITLLKATSSSSRREVNRQEKYVSFSQYQEEILNTKRSFYGEGLTFDPLQYKAHREAQISNEAKTILSMEPKTRTPEQLHVALMSLQSAVDAFSEFPIKMQQSLVRVGWYEHFEAKRVIIRQGHTADNFYFILSGTAVVTLLDTDKATGESFSRTAALLGKGNSFGELALMHGAKRSATVTCQNDVELLAVGREDFIDIFMHVEKNIEPEHVQYLRTIEQLNGWPVDRLPWNDPKICLFTYFRRGTVMCRDSNKSEWIYIIKTGSCRVLKTLYASKPNVSGLEIQDYTVPSKVNTYKPLKCGLTKSKTTLSSLTSSSVDTDDDIGAVSRVNGVLTSRSRENFPSPHKGLPPIQQKTQEEVKQELEAHQKRIDKMFKDKHNPEPVSKEKTTPENGKLNKVFVQLVQLGPKSTFGLDHVAFSLMNPVTSVSLVSDGAEAVLISKKFFLQHLSDDHRKKLRVTLQPYPTEESLQQKFQDNTNWDAFKTMAINNHVLYNKFVQDTLNY